MQQRRAKRYQDLAAGGLPAPAGASAVDPAGDQQRLATRHAEAVAAARALAAERPLLAPQLERVIAAAAPLP